MDLVDKRLLLELNENCRLSYNALGKKVGLTRAAVKKRVDRLVEMNVIDRFVVELSKEMTNYDWYWIEIQTDGSEGTDSFVGNIAMHPMAFILNRLGGSRYLVLAQVAGAHGLYELGRHLRQIQGVTGVHMDPILPVNYTSMKAHGIFSPGNVMNFTNRDLKVLKCLVDDARMQTSEISRITGISAKSVRNSIKKMHEKKGVYFTVYTRPSACGNTDFFLEMDIDEILVDPLDVVVWMESHFHLEYWNTWVLANAPCMRSFFSAKNLYMVEKIAEKVREATLAKSVEPVIKYPNRVFQSLGRTRLLELLATVE